MLRGFIDRPGVICKRKRKVKDATKVTFFPLQQLEECSCPLLRWKITERGQVTGAEFLTHMFEMPDHCPSEDIDWRGRAQGRSQG